MTNISAVDIDISPATSHRAAAPPASVSDMNIQMNQAIMSLQATAPQTYVQLQQALKRDDARAVISIPPHLIRHSKYANRLEASMQGKAFLELKGAIKTSNGNSQPIFVRPIAVAAKSAGTSDEASAEFLYEIVSGHRRHLACRELGLRVSAVVVTDMSDKELVLAMHHENHARAALSPWEYGLMLNQWREFGLFKSLHEMSRAIGRDVTSISRAISLVKLPAVVIAAFESPVLLQYKDADLINLALERNNQAVMAVAKGLSVATEKLPRNEVLKRLVEASVAKDDAGLPNAARTDDIKVGEQVVGAIHWDAQGKAKVTISQSVSQSAQRELQNLLANLLRRDARQPSTKPVKNAMTLH